MSSALTVPLQKLNISPPLFLSVIRSPVKHHSREAVSISLEVDARGTSIPHLKARCLLSLAPGLRDLNASDLAPGTLPAGTATSDAESGRSSSTVETRRLKALAGLVDNVRLADSAGSSALDESSASASVHDAKVKDGASLTLVWGAPPACGKAIVKFWVMKGEPR